ncbi:MAG: BON domain-containing protein [Edaphobacter sp.]|uniref:BON domain-containing protein n=1 Tax=Edaphobacter sp. TaxID=1934404 RepID=UPI00238624D0|nr:BON domain-containing protein [Edaphobacter sp.]MDE1178088.1 BON domain-containing protein [Edaphobacter sp.]
MRHIQAFCLSLVLACTPSLALAQDQAAQAAPDPTWSQEDFTRIVTDVQKQLGSLTTYSVFDWITFGVHGKTVVLKGFASRPILKSDAENALKRVKDISTVENEIVVLPLSNNDDRIRAQVYSRIYTQASLRKYNANQGSIARAMGPGGGRFGMMAGGITQNPPIGYHAIHIIVNNGHVTLYGVVLNTMDSNIAYIQANGTSGVFSVDNDLVVQGSKPGQAPK